MVAAVAASLALAGAAGPVAEAAPAVERAKPKSFPARVEILTRSQATVARRGRVRARIAFKGRGVARIGGRILMADGGRLLWASMGQWTRGVRHPEAIALVSDNVLRLVVILAVQAIRQHGRGAVGIERDDPP